MSITSKEGLSIDKIDNPVNMVIQYNLLITQVITDLKQRAHLVKEMGSTIIESGA